MSPQIPLTSVRLPLESALLSSFRPSFLPSFRPVLAFPFRSFSFSKFLTCHPLLLFIVLLHLVLATWCGVVLHGAM